jgi:hypothetical protein
MQGQSVSLEYVREELSRARNNPSSKNRFSKKLWDDIFSLTKIYSFNVVCKELNLCRYFLAKKIKMTQTIRKEKEWGDNGNAFKNFHIPRQAEIPPAASKKPIFREIPFEPLPNHDNIVIELTKLDLKARIDGGPLMMK